MVYGTFTKTGKEPTELEHEFMNDNFTYDFDKDALRTVLTGRFTRMGQLIRTEVLQKQAAPTNAFSFRTNLFR